MSINEETMNARRWDAYPQLHIYLKEKSIDERWLPWSSIEHTLMDHVNDANKIFQLLDSNIEYLSAVAFPPKSKLGEPNESVCRELQKFEEHLMYIANTFYSRATSIKSLGRKLRENVCLDSMPQGTNLADDLSNEQEIFRLFQIINFLCASVAWYTVQYGRYEETPIEELLTFYGLKLTETISEKDSGEFSKILERRIREYLSKW